jgi:hypothetical protein
LRLWVGLGLRDETQEKAVILKSAPIVCVGQGKGADFKIDAILYLERSVAGVFIAIIDDWGNVDMQGFPQDRMGFWCGINQEPAGLGQEGPVQYPQLRTVHGVPFQGVVSIGIVGRSSRGIDQEYRSEICFFPDKKIEAPLRVVTHHHILLEEGQIRKGDLSIEGHDEQDEATDKTENPVFMNHDPAAPVLPEVDRQVKRCVPILRIRSGSRICRRVPDHDSEPGDLAFIGNGNELLSGNIETVCLTEGCFRFILFQGKHDLLYGNLLGAAVSIDHMNGQLGFWGVQILQDVFPPDRGRNKGSYGIVERGIINKSKDITALTTRKEEQGYDDIDKRAL